MFVATLVTVAVHVVHVTGVLRAAGAKASKVVSIELYPTTDILDSRLVMTL